MSLPPSRRGLLQAALLAPWAAGCTKPAPRPARIDPDVALRDAAIVREQSLLALYTGATAPALVAIRTEHEQHLAVLGAALPSVTAAASASSAAQLAAAERAAAAAHAAGALQASRSLAVVLASLAASEASHPVALA